MSFQINESPFIIFQQNSGGGSLPSSPISGPPNLPYDRQDSNLSASGFDKLFHVMIMPPPSVTGKLYCFPLRQLIFSFGRCVVCHSKGLSSRVHSEINSVCLYHDLQTNSWSSFLNSIFDVMHQWIRLDKIYNFIENFFPNFGLVFKFLAKNWNFSNELRGVNIDHSAMCCVSMDLPWQALQTNGLFQISFRITDWKPKFFRTNIDCTNIDQSAMYLL